MIAKMGLCQCVGALLGPFTPGHFWQGTIGGAVVGLVIAALWIESEARR